MTTRKIYIDPPSQAFYRNRFFTDSELNRDECLRPYISLRENLALRGIELNTFDLWDRNGEPAEYYSFGMMDNLNMVADHPEISLKGFYIFEPPVVDPSMYDSLPRLTEMFDEVFIHNTEGDGYSLLGVDQTKLRKLYWPQPFDHVIEPYWSNRDREKRVVVINGNHKPASRNKELYSKRIEAMVKLSGDGAVDLYGRGWDRWFSRSSMWLPYWKNRKTLLSIYKGPCESKFEVLSRYEFCLCFENMEMKGYMTEKLFDCLYAGCVPIYYGAPDIKDYVDHECYIDCSRFHNWDDLLGYIMSLSVSDIEVMREKGQAFLESETMKPYNNALISSIDQ